ncbi:hypothetical protein ACLB2K_069155 [Fragaria x ananassa]
MELLSRQDFEGMVLNPNSSSLEILTMVTAVAHMKLMKEKQLEKQRMMGNFNSKKDEAEAYQSVSTKQETRVVEKSTNNKPLVVTSKKKKPMVMEPKNTLGCYSGNLQLQMDTLNCKKEPNCVIEKESSPFIPQTRRRWEPQKENGVREQKDMSIKKNGLKRKFQDEHDRENKKLVPHSTGDLPDEFKNQNETSGGIKVELMIGKKLVKSDCVDNDANDYDSDCALRNKKHKGFKRRHKRKIVPNRNATTTSHDLPENFKKKIESMGGSKVNLVIEKTLYMSDLALNQNRLSMPFKQLRSKFLEDDEVRRLANHETFTLPLIDTRLQEREICLSEWSMPTSKWYALKTQWHKKIVVENELREGDLIQVWSFRDKGNNLHLALCLVERKDEASDAAGCRKKSKNGFLLGEISNRNSGGSSV